MHVWHHVKGVPGRLVGHPEQGGERRFIGKLKKDPETCANLRAEGADLAELYDDVNELVKASGHELVRLERAIARGDLQRIANHVVAHSHAAAMAKLDVAKPAAPAEPKPADPPALAAPKPAVAPADAIPDPPPAAPVDAPPAKSRKGN